MDDPLRIVNCAEDPQAKPHFHRDEQGMLVKCYHKCRNNWLVGFCVGTTLSFPFEHWLYEKVWPFNLLTQWLGL